MGTAPTGTAAPAAPASNAATNAGASPAAPAANPAQPPAPAAAGTAPAAPAPAGGSNPAEPAWTAERTKQAERSLLRKFDVETPEELAAKLKLLDDLQTEKLSDAEKAKKQIDELTPQVAEGARYKKLFGDMVEQKFTALPEAVRTAIDAAAQGDADKRFDMINVMSAAGVIQPGAAPATPPAAGAAPAPGAPAVPGPPAPATTNPAPPAPSAASPQTKFAQWDAIGDPTQRSLFYRINSAEIERTRPA